MGLRSIIVDDEPAARELLEELLENEPIEVVGSFGDPTEAVPAIIERKPDVLFLDVQMPTLTGFDLLQALGEHAPRAVIFVTAYDRHAIAAFDVNAIDYLLKPFDVRRLRIAVARAMERIPLTALQTSPAVDQKVTPRDPLRLLPIRLADRILLAPVEEVSMFEAEGKYVRVHFGQTSRRVRMTMQALEQRLDPDRFIRISRSTIVNLHHVKHLERWSHGQYVLALRSGAKVTSTQGYRTRLRRVLRTP